MTLVTVTAADLPLLHGRRPPVDVVGDTYHATMAKLLLLDGHSLAYRAFYALPSDLATKAGTVTNAVYGFTSMLTKVLADEKPDYIAVAFDAPGGSTYRNELDSGVQGRPQGDARPLRARSCR